jgi:hypothetical protein
MGLLWLLLVLLVLLVLRVLHVSRLRGRDKETSLGSKYSSRPVWHWGKKKLAEKGGLEAELEPDGVFGIWNAGACRLNTEDEDPAVL